MGQLIRRTLILIGRTIVAVIALAPPGAQSEKVISSRDSAHLHASTIAEVHRFLSLPVKMRGS
jgi:hypothetical protein